MVMTQGPFGGRERTVTSWVRLYICTMRSNVAELRARVDITPCPRSADPFNDYSQDNFWLSVHRDFVRLFTILAHGNPARFPPDSEFVYFEAFQMMVKNRQYFEFFLQIVFALKQTLCPLY